MSARDIVRAIIEEGVLDPISIAEKAMASADEDAFAEAAFHGFAEMASQQHRRTRGSAPSAQPTDAGWEGARQAVRDHTAWPVWVPEVGWKVLGDCSVDEVRAVAQHRWAESERLAEWARWYDALADRMDAAGVSTVADLPSTKVRARSMEHTSGADEQESVA